MKRTVEFIHIPDVIRWSLTIGMLYGCFTETGVWTGACMTALFINVECQLFLSKVRTAGTLSRSKSLKNLFK